MNRVARYALPLIIVATAVAGCSPAGNGAEAAKPPLDGARIGGPFTLTDQNGQRVSDSAFAGKYRIVYFGYSYCPDVCPVDVQNIGAALRQMEARDPARAARIVPIFITVDPERDTPPVLKQFVTAFHPRMVGLTGAPAEIARVAREYAIFYRKQPAGPGGGYLVDHSRLAYLFAPDGRPIALLPQEKTPAAIVAELDRWVR